MIVCPVCNAVWQRDDGELLHVKVAGPRYARFFICPTCQIPIYVKED